MFPEEIELVLILTFTTLLMPINFINKLVFAKLTNHNYKITVTDILDFTIVGVVFFLWFIVLKYESDDIKYNLFSPEEDSTKSVKFMGNISFNVIDERPETIRQTVAYHRELEKIFGADRVEPAIFFIGLQGQFLLVLFLTLTT